MTPNENLDVAEILTGYEAWRRYKSRDLQPGDDPLSVSHYLDDLARQRAYDAVEQIREVYADPELTWQEVDARIREILGG